MDLENEVKQCFCPECEGDPEAVMDLETPKVAFTCHCGLCENDPEAAEEEIVSETVSEDETPTTSDEDFIVSDSEMEEVEADDSIEDQLELLFESFVNLQEENKLLKKELEKQGSLLFEICKDLKKNITPAK